MGSSALVAAGGRADTGAIPPLTVGRYIRSFAPAPAWRSIPRWPPDAYAVASLVLDHTETYRFAVAPPPPFRWPPAAGWEERVVAAAREWRATAARNAPAPRCVLEQYEFISRRRDVALGELHGGRDAELSVALLTLHAMADETASDLMSASPSEFERRAWERLESAGSLARLSPVRIRVLPKTRVPRRGLTIRSFSRHLALSYEAVAVDWQRLQPGRPLPPHRDFNVVLLPWPLSLKSRDFHPARGPVDNMDPGLFGFFEFAPEQPLPAEVLGAVLRAAGRHVRRLDVVILPESAIDAAELPAIEAVLEEHGVVSLISGVRERVGPNGFGGNRVLVAMRIGGRWRHIEQAKHHRWCLDGPQIRQYHLSGALDVRRQWWEAIDLPKRSIEVLDSGGGVTVAPLICEDLARIDEVADVLRRVGPTLVTALLLDGPQLRTRWPVYASILTDDPGSAVLTLTSLGMATRSRPSGVPASRVIASWSDPTTGTTELELRRGATALLVTGTVAMATAWTADGRRHDDVANLTLSSVHQLSAR
jgi:hypothetical protein